MAAPSEETDDLVDELPTIVDHTEFEDEPANIAPDADVVEQPEVSAEDKTQETAVVEEILDHHEIDPAPITDEAIEEYANTVDEHHDAIDNAEAPEESLQHFAHMLRTGKLARKEDGLFVVTDEIVYQVMPKAG